MPPRGVASADLDGVWQKEHLLVKPEPSPQRGHGPFQQLEGHFAPLPQPHLPNWQPLPCTSLPMETPPAPWLCRLGVQGPSG